MPKKLTTEEFIRRSKEVHGDRYDYSKVEYVKSSEKVCIICRIHGEFWQIAASHLSGRGCEPCSYEQRGIAQRGSLSSFILKANNKFGGKFDYSMFKYEGVDEKSTIICPIHGETLQSAYNHLKSDHGCYQCNKQALGDKYAYTNYEFIEAAKLIHGDKYDYSKVNYRRSREEVCIICHVHGEFWQKPSSHLAGHGCNICSSFGNGFSRSSFVEKCKVNDEKGLLYVISCFNSSESFVKIGITSKSIDERFPYKTSMPYEYIVLSQWHGDSGNIFDVEKFLHNEVVICSKKYSPKISFDCSRLECFESKHLSKGIIDWIINLYSKNNSCDIIQVE